jgi:hypothetical protein
MSAGDTTRAIIIHYVKRDEVRRADWYPASKHGSLV